MADLARIQEQMLDKKWQWYTVRLEGTEPEDDEEIELEAYSHQDAMERAVAQIKAVAGTLCRLNGEAYVWVGRKQLLSFKTKG